VWVAGVVAERGGDIGDSASRSAVRAVSFDGDRSQVRTGNGQQIMAALRSPRHDRATTGRVTNIAAALRHHARDPHRPLATYQIA